jgi:hypothetical protein
MTPRTKNNHIEKREKNQDLFNDMEREKMIEMSTDRDSHLYYFASEDAMFHFRRGGFTLPWHMQESDYIAFCVEKTIGNVKKEYTKLYSRVHAAQSSIEIYKLLVMRITSNLKNCLKCVDAHDMCSEQNDGIEMIETEIELGKIPKSEIEKAIQKMLSSFEIDIEEAEELGRRYGVSIETTPVAIESKIDNEKQLRFFNTAESNPHNKNYYQYEKRKKMRDFKSKYTQGSLFMGGAA